MTLLALMSIGSPNLALAAEPGFDAHGFSVAALSNDPRAALEVETPTRFSAWDWYSAALLEYAKDPLVEHTVDTDGLDTSSVYLDNLLALNLSGGVALASRLRLDLALPLYLTSTGPDATAQGFDPGDLRAGALIVLVRPTDEQAPGLGVGVQPWIVAPTGTSDQFLGQSGVSGGARALAAYSTERWTFGAEAGAAFEPSVEVENLQGSDRLTLGAHVGFLPQESLGVNLEGTAAVPFKPNSEPGTDTPAELTLSVRKQFDSGAQLTLGGASAVSRGASAATYRVFLGGGVGTPPDRGPKDRDLDGLADDLDQCPDQPEVKNGRADDDGCPDSLSALAVSASYEGKRVTGARVDLAGPSGAKSNTTSDGPWVVDTKAGESWTAMASFGECLAGTATATTTEARTDLPVDLKPVRSVHTVVEAVDGSGRPVLGARVTWSSPGVGCVNTNTVAAGAPTAMGPGTHTASVMADGFRPASVTAQFVSGDNKTLRVVMEASQAAVVGARIVIMTPVYFDHNQDTIRQDSFKVLVDVLDVMKNHPEFTRLEIAGHTDSDGTDAYNLDLSQRRVNSVRNFLVGKGIEPDRLVAKGYGETVAIASNKSADGKARNRRVEFNILERGDGGVVAPAPTAQSDGKGVKSPSQ